MPEYYKIGYMKACIFDLDGVIVDTARYHFLAWKELSEELGIPFTEHDNELLKGVSRVRSLEIILDLSGKKLDEDTFNDCLDKKNKRFLEYIHQMTPDEVLPGVIDFLNELKENRIKIALGSASKNARLILTQVKMLDYFDAIVDGNSVKEAKPNPEVFLKGAAALGIEAKECVVFEDAIAGVEAAHNGGMKVVGVGSADILHQADYIITTFENLKLETINFILYPII